jgi:mannose-6-phosphate isomerase-like protein (cupin superfamily)
MPHQYPYSFNLGPSEKFTVLGPTEREEGICLEAENVLQPGARVPMHVHYLQEEGFTVLAGRAGYQLAGAGRAYLEPGQSVRFAPGVPHRFWNEGGDVLHIRGYMRPPLNSEYFMVHMAESINENGGKEPNLLDAAYLIHFYRREYGLGGSFVLRLLIPIIAVVARIAGRGRKYAAAPPPAVG